MTMTYPTRFQFQCTRTLFSIYLAVLFVAVLPYDITSHSLALNPERWDFLYNPILRILWSHKISTEILWLSLGLLSLALWNRWISAFLFLVWTFEFNLSVFRYDPGSFLISYILLFIYAYNQDRPIKYLFPMFWVLFFATTIFDFIASANTILDLFPFGMKYELTSLPNKSWMYLRTFIYVFFWTLMTLRQWRWLGWVSLLAFHLAWSVHFGFTLFSGSTMMALIFLFNPRWTTTPSDPKLKPYIFFDGVCVLCDHFTRFLFAEDFGRHFFYAPLQGATAKQKLPREDQNQIQTVIFLDEGKYYYRLDAIIKIFSEVGGMWHLIKVFWLLPAAVRDWIYSLVASHRYQWFGTLNYCRFPTTEEKQYFRD